MFDVFNNFKGPMMDRNDDRIGGTRTIRVIEPPTWFDYFEKERYVKDFEKYLENNPSIKNLSEEELNKIKEGFEGGYIMAQERYKSRK